MQSLRDKIEDAKTDYFAKYGCLDWHWYDEGLYYTVADYFSSKGEFSEDDKEVLKEYEFVPEDFYDEEDFKNQKIKELQDEIYECGRCLFGVAGIATLMQHQGVSQKDIENNVMVKAYTDRIDAAKEKLKALQGD